MSITERQRLRTERVAAEQTARRTIQTTPTETADRYRHRTTRRRAPAPWLCHRLGPMLWLTDFVVCLGVAEVIPAGGQTTLGVALVMATLMGLGGLNRPRLSLSVLDDLPQILMWWFVGAGVLLVVSELMTNNMQLALLAATLPGLIVGRLVAYTVVRVARSRGWAKHNAVIVGAGTPGQLVADALLQHPESGLRAIGFVDAASPQPRHLPLAVLCEADKLGEVLEGGDVHALIVSHGGMEETSLVSLVRKCQRHRCEVFVLPRLHEVTHVGREMDAIGDLPLIRLRRSAYRSFSWQIKRLVDVAFSAGAILLLSPLLASLALATRLETGRGVIFRQERVGRDGVSFELMKFQSLKPVDENESQTNWNISTDHRVGPVGKLMRKTSLDELPQLFNILRGDMSLVGPRPERPHFVEQFGELYTGYADRHRVPCGLTGWAQIHGLRGNTPIDQRARFDNFYIENWTLWLDIKIILRTAVSVFTKPGS